MSQHVGDVLVHLEEQIQQSTDGSLSLGIGLVKAAVDGLRSCQELEAQLAEANELLSLKPTLAKKLNDKIQLLQAEIEVLRSDTKVNELERKVRRLELELKQSYATKNFTLKSGLLEIEKVYRDFIHSNEDVEELWGEIMLLLVEDRDPEQDMAANMLQRRQASLMRGKSPLKAAAAEAAAAAAGELEQEHVVQVQEQVQKLHLADPGGATPGPMPADGRPPRVSAGPPRAALDPDARYCDVIPENMTLGSGGVQDMRGLYTHDGGPLPQPGDGRSRPAPPPPGLFRPGGPVDASALQAQEDVVAACVAQLRQLFAAACPPLSAAQPGGRRATVAAVPEGRAVPDASSLYRELDEVQVSVRELMQLYSVLAGHSPLEPPTGRATSTAAASSGSAPPVQPDASYFSARAEAVLASLQHLRQLYSLQQGPAAAGPRDPAAASASVGGAATRGQAEPREADASAGAGGLDVQFQQLENTILSLRSTFAEAGSSGPPHAAPGARAAAAGPPLASAGAGSTGAVAAAAAAGLGPLPVDPSLLPSEPLIALFTSFMAHISSKGAYPSRSKLQLGGGHAPTGDGPEDAAPSAYEMTSLFQKFLRAPGGPPGLAPAHREALAAAALEAGPSGMLPAMSEPLTVGALEAMQRRVEAKHAELLASVPEAVELWDDAQRLLACAATLAGTATEPASGAAPESQSQPRKARRGGKQAAAPSPGVEQQQGSASVGPSGGPEPGPLPLHGEQAAAQSTPSALEDPGAADPAAEASASEGPAAMASQAAKKRRQRRKKGAGGGAGGADAAAADDALANSTGDLMEQRGLGSGGRRSELGTSDELLRPRDAGSQPDDDDDGDDDDNDDGDGCEDEDDGSDIGSGSGPDSNKRATSEDDVGGRDDSPRPPANGDGPSPLAPGRPPASPLQSKVLDEDELSVVDQLRRLNMDYAERLADLDMSVTDLRREHRAEKERAAELQMRLGAVASEAAALREDNEVLTRLLVDVKVLFAEKESENMLLQQRLKRSLKFEHEVRDENEELKLKLEGPPDLLTGDATPHPKEKTGGMLSRAMTSKH